MLSSLRCVRAAVVQRRPADGGARSLGERQAGLDDTKCNLPEGFQAGAALKEIEPNENSIAAGLQNLLTMSDAERATMGCHARTLVETRFTWEQVGKQMRAVHEWILGGGARPKWSWKLELSAKYPVPFGYERNFSPTRQPADSGFVALFARSFRPRRQAC